jgi:predicted RNase H-like nuclease
MSTAVGVDWAGGCWVVVAYTESGDVEITTEPAILNVWEQHREAETLLVDIPIGLPENSPRDCDEAAKEFLGDRQSSVFAVPAREAIESRNYEDAREENDGLGSQSWGLIPRIREVDTFLRIHDDARSRIYESHPEVCFEQFARQTAMAPVGSKQQADGIDARLDILEAVDEAFGSQVREFVDERRKDSPWHYRIQSGRLDDVVDAAVLALTATTDDDFTVFPEGRTATDERVIIAPPTP